MRRRSRQICAPVDNGGQRKHAEKAGKEHNGRTRNNASRATCRVSAERDVTMTLAHPEQNLGDEVTRDHEEYVQGSESAGKSAGREVMNQHGENGDTTQHQNLWAGRQRASRTAHASVNQKAAEYCQPNGATCVLCHASGARGQTELLAAQTVDR